MKDFLVVLFVITSGIAAQKIVHLVPSSIICPNVLHDEDILVPDPRDCKIYYKCKHGIAVPQKCPYDYLWCNIVKHCTLPALANCSIGNTVVTYSPEELATYKTDTSPPTSSGTESSTSEEPGTHTNHETTESGPTSVSMESSTSEEPPSTSSTTVTQSPEVNQCPMDGMQLPNEADCRSYWICENSNPVLEYCPPGFGYSCWNQECEPEAEANCINSGPQDGKPCKMKHLKLPNTKDCEQYYECDGHKVQPKTCEEHGFQYNKWSQNCTKPSLAHCPANTTETSSSTTEKSTNSYKTTESGPTSVAMESSTSEEPPSTSSTTVTQSPEVNQCPMDGMQLPNEADCRSYWICENSNPVLEYCPPGFGYSCWNQECEPEAEANCINSGPQDGKPCKMKHLKLPNIKDCEQYYECDGHKVQPKTCEEHGFQYNKWSQNCTKPSLAHCPANTTETSSSTTEKSTNSYETTESGPTSVAMESSTSEEPPSTSSTTVTQSPEVNQCPMDGMQLPNEADCRSYWICENSNPVLEYCPPGFGYSCWNQECEPEAEANCINSGPQDGKPCKMKHLKLPNTKDCEQYYECDGHKVQPKTCEEHGFQYNKWSQNCTKPSLAHCPANTTETSSSTTEKSTNSYETTESGPTSVAMESSTSEEPPSTSSTTVTQSPEVNQCPMDGMQLPNEADCRSYWICENSNPVLEYCPPGFGYSCWNQECEPEAEANCINSGPQDGKPCKMKHLKLPNIKDCEQYYECDGHKVQPKTCEEHGFQYNKWSQNCTKPSLAHCPANTTETSSSTTEKSTNSYETTESGPTSVAMESSTSEEPPSTSSTTVTQSPEVNQCPMDGMQLPNEADCRSYWICENSNPVLEYCPPGFGYSCWNQECEPEAEANCINSGPQDGKPCKMKHLKLPNIKDCEQYYECDGHKVQPKTCEEHGFQYNKWSQNCTKPSLAHCPANTTETSSSTTEKSTNSYETTESGPTSVAMESSTSEEPPSTSSTTVTQSPEVNQCPMDGMQLPNEADCRSYWICENNNPVLEYCPPGFGYSCWNQECEPEAEANCINSGPQDGKPCKMKNLKLPNIKDCEQYYECDGHKVQPKTCEEHGLQYNKWSQNCTKPSLAHCPANTTETSSSTTEKSTNSYETTESGPTSVTMESSTSEEPPSTSSTTVTQSPEVNQCPMDGMQLPNEADCRSYWICENSNPVLEYCPPGFGYSCWNQECEPEVEANCINSGPQDGKPCKMKNLKLPNIKDCEQYYECDGHKVQPKTCEEHGLQYNKWSQNCTKPSLAHCPANTTETSSSTTEKSTNSYETTESGPTSVTMESSTSEEPPSTSSTTVTQSPDVNQCPMDGMQLPNEADCRSYWICENSNPVLEYCPPGFGYSCWNQECEPEAEANCINSGPQDGKPCKMKNLKLPNIKDCEQYYECDGHKVQPKTCEEHGLQYNKWSQNCTKPSLAHCPANTTETSSSTTEKSTNSYETTESGPTSVTMESSTSEEPPSTSSTTVTQSPEVNQCPMDGMQLPNEADCGSYWICENSNPVLEYCPPGFGYSCWNQECEPEAEANCINSGPQDGKPCKMKNLKLPNIKDCEQYYECDGHKVQPKTCEEHGLQYNKWSQNCTKPSLAHCPANTTETSSSTTEKSTNSYETTESGPTSVTMESSTSEEPPSTSSTTVTQSPEVNQCPMDGMQLPNEADCRSYWICENSNPVLEYCPPGFGYSCWNQECEPEAEANCINSGPQDGKPCKMKNLKLPNIKDCEQYYECDGHKVQPKTCEKHGLQYNKWSQNCTKPSLAHCPANTTETSSSTTEKSTNSYETTESGPTSVAMESSTSEEPPSTSSTTVTQSPEVNQCPMDGMQLPNEADCRSYWICENSNPVLEYCPPGFGYSCWNQECEPEAEANCINSGPQDGKPCKMKNLKLANIKDCEQYYECDGHKVQPKTCEEHGLQYNKWSQNCTKPSLAHCPANTTETSSSTTEKSTNSYETTESGPTSVTMESSTSEEPPSTSSTTVTQSPEVNQCPMDGMQLPNEADCRSYWICENSNPVLEYCPPGFGYSCWNQECEPEDEANCINSGPQDGKPCKMKNLKLPNIKDCEQYYECDGHKVQPKTCEEHGLQYNKWSQNCTKPSLAHCPANTTETSSSTTEKSTNSYETTESGPTSVTMESSTSEEPPSTSSTTVTQSPDVNQCPMDGMQLPNEADCRSYWICENSNPVLEYCPPGFGYSCWNQECEPEAEANCINSGPQDGKPCKMKHLKLPNIKDCEQYYECDGHKVQPKTCEEHGLQYNKWSQNCTKPSLAHCPANTTETSSSTTEKSTNSYETTESGPTSVTMESSTSEEPPSTSSTTVTQSPEVNQCPMDGMQLPNEADCRSYWICENSNPVLEYCPPGFGYSCWNQECEPEAEANCINSGPQDGKPCKMKNLKLPNIKDCEQYYECDGHKVQPKTCEEHGLQYNKWSQNCTKPSLAHCPANTTETSSSTTEKSTNSYETTESGPTSVTMESSTSEEPPSTSSTTVTQSPDVNQCPMDGMQLPNEADCRSYWICENSNPVLEYCPPGFGYSCWNQECEPEAEANCINSGPQDGKPCKMKNLKLPNIKDCEQYYECDGHKVQPKTCEEHGLQYNKWSQNCTKPSLAHCPANTTETSSSTTEKSTNSYETTESGPTSVTMESSTSEEPPSTSSTTVTPSTVENLCPMDGMQLPNEADCSSYWVCKNSNPVLEYCPPGYGYSCWNQECEPEAEANCINSGPQEGKPCKMKKLKLPNIKDCEEYYECDGQKVQPKTCEEHGLQYNKWFEKCYKPSLAHCPANSTSITSVKPPSTVSLKPNPNVDICPYDGILLPNPVNCSSYYKCINGTPTIEYCGLGLEYDCWNSTCEPADEANCIAYGSHTGKTCKSNGQRTQNPQNCHSYYECQNGKIQSINCVFNWYYNKWFEICVPFAILAHCKTTPIIPHPPVVVTKAPEIFRDICPIEGALIPHPSDCTQYYECKNYNAILRKCPENEKYSCWDQKCMSVANATCISDPNQAGKDCAREGVKLQSTLTCDGYYECCNGKVQKKFCSIWSRYNKWYSKCTVPILAHCQIEASSTSTTYAPTLAPGGDGVDIGNCSSSNTEIANPAKCNSYIKCENKRKKRYICPNGKTYDVFDKKCKNKAKCIRDIKVHDSCRINNEVYPKINDCSCYYKCEKNEIVHKDCGWFKKFDIWRKKCTASLFTVQCADNSIFGII